MSLAYSNLTDWTFVEPTYQQTFESAVKLEYVNVNHGLENAGDKNITIDFLDETPVDYMGFGIQYSDSTIFYTGLLGDDPFYELFFSTLEQGIVLPYGPYKEFTRLMT